MSKISLSPDASGTGIFTIASPNSNTNRTLTLPDDTGTIVTNSGNQAGSFTTLNTSGQVVFNDAGADVDFRVESDTDENALFVDGATGNIGIGTAGYGSYFSGRKNISLGEGVTINASASGGDPNLTLCSNAFFTSTPDYKYIVSDFASQYEQYNGTHTWSNAPSGTAGNTITFTERMRIDSSGRLLVGTTGLPNNGTISSYTNTSAPAGRFYAGASVADGNIALMVDKYSTTNTTSQWFLGFTINNQATASGVITANGASQAAFGTWSDRRLKENIVDLTPQLDNICALRPVEFDYIESEGGGHQISFIAQEFEKVYPDAIGERSDGMKTLTGWDKTSARLVKAIQELKAELDTVKAELATLKG